MLINYAEIDVFLESVNFIYLFFAPALISKAKVNMLAEVILRQLMPL